MTARRRRESTTAASRTERASARAGASDQQLGSLLEAGNRAISALIQRQPVPQQTPLLPPNPYQGWPGLDPDAGGPQPEPAAEAAPKHHGRKTPDWFKLSSEQGALPGDPVLGVKGPPYTEEDRLSMRQALDDRLGENEPRADELAKEVPEAIVEVWTDFVTDAMKEKALEDEGWPFWAKVLSFGARAVLMVVLFPEAEAEAAAESIGHVLLEKGTEFVLEQGQELAQEKTGEAKKESKLDSEAERLVKMSGAASSAITGAISPVMRQMSQGIDYDRWLTRAPLESLGEFRVPPLIAEVKPAELKARFAQAVAGMEHDRDSVAVEYRSNWGIFDDNSHDKPSGDEQMIVLEIGASGVQAGVVGEPHFIGSTALLNAMAGAPLKQLPNVPLMITFRASPGAALGPVVADMAVLDSVFDAYPGKSPAKILRYSDGTIAVNEGGLAEHFHLYQRMNPGEDLSDILLGASKGIGEPVSPERLPGDAAKELWQLFFAYLVAGAEQMLAEVVDPVALSAKAGWYH